MNIYQESDVVQRLERLVYTQVIRVRFSALEFFDFFLSLIFPFFIIKSKRRLLLAIQI